MDMSLSQLQEIVKDRDAWYADVRRVAKSHTDLETEQQYINCISIHCNYFSKLRGENSMVGGSRGGDGGCTPGEHLLFKN